ncbi:MAG: methyl-accepting chemotaxis protein, partial [Verrucomicrobiota bacterium]
SPRFASVREGMESQTQGASQISDAMSNLKDGAQRSKDSLTEFDQATQALHSAVNNLRREVSRFKVAERMSSGYSRLPFPVGSKGDTPAKTPPLGKAAHSPFPSKKE